MSELCVDASVVVKLVLKGESHRITARRLLRDSLDKVTVQILTHPNLRQHAREIAGQFNLRTVYDATYAALAELRGCEFWTADKVFYDMVNTVLTFVKYLPDYP